MGQQLIGLLILLLTMCYVNGQCVPGKTCKLPSCRCWNDRMIPGNINKTDTPQMVLVSFEYAVNRANIVKYKGIFEGVSNPNKCPLKATFFVQKLYTDFQLVKQLYDEGNEIGMTSLDGKLPQNSSDWLKSYSGVKTAITDENVPGEFVKGSRAPKLSAGGDSQFDAIDKVGLTYDSTCTSSEYAYKDNTLWPYTYDFVSGTPKCNIGQPPTKPYPGKWQFLVATTHFKGQACASLSACSPFIKTAKDAFDMLFETFADHYEGSKSPFVLYIDPAWLTIDYQYEGTKAFIQFIRAGYKDTWFVTHQQSMAWINNPVTSLKANNFKPWTCSQ